jgi:O-antigen biosynthesis protein
MKRVSVITPCYNAAPFVAATIEAVRAQTYPCIEHIVVDDGSTDGSWEVIQRYANRVTAMRLERNRGGSHARNRGAAVARGDFLMFLDADDLISLDAIEALVAAAGDRPRCIATCDCRRWKGVAEGPWIEAECDRPVPQAETDLVEAFLTMSAWPPTCSVLWSRTAYELTEGWDEEMGGDQDTDILLRAYVRGAQIQRSERGVGYYRLVESGRPSVSRAVSLRRYLGFVRVIDKLSLELDRTGRTRQYSGLLARGYYWRARYGFELGYSQPAREALRKARAMERHLASRTTAGRLLERFLGLERKEGLIRVLAGLGIATSDRRRVLEDQRRHRLQEQV